MAPAGVYPDFDFGLGPERLVLSFSVLNPLQRCRAKRMCARIPGATLSERPNVRVRADPVNMCFAREAEGRVAGLNSQGHR